MATFPALSSGAACKYPVSRTVQRRHTVHQFCDLSEQRYMKGLPLAEFRLEYNWLKTADKEILRAFWDSQNGIAGATWTLVFDGVTYPKCQFTGTFNAQLQSTGIWKVVLTFRSLGLPQH
jgi:hypothetical protein